MGNVHRTSMIVHDQAVRPDGTGPCGFFQPEGLMDFAAGSDSGVTFSLDVHGTVGTATSWYLTCMFNLGMGDIDGAGFSKQRWRALQPEQLLKLIVEGVDWYAGTSQPFTLQNLCTNPSAETASTGWSSIAGTGGTAATARQTSFGYAGTACMRNTWSVGTTSNNTGGIGGPLSSGMSAGQHVSGSMRAKPSKDQWLRGNLEFRDVASAVLATRQGTAVFCPANEWTLLPVADKTAPTSTTQARVTAVAGSGSTAWAAGDTLDGDACMVNIGTSPNAYFDGDSDQGTWLGTAHASASTLLVTPTGPDTDVIARNTDTLPITVSRTIKNFGRLVDVVIIPVAVGASSDFAVRYSLTAGY